MNGIPRVACINDLSGYGRCSLTVAIPILSVLGVQCCPVPTAVLSCHTGFDNFFFKDLTKILPDFINNWREQKICFDAIYTGFLGSFEQIKIAEEFIKINENKSLCIVDTVMGDNGRIYPTYTEKMCDEMRKLVSISDVITPNITEACHLTETPYSGESITISEGIILAKKLYEMGAKAIVITGIEKQGKLINLVYKNENGVQTATPFTVERTAKTFSGTGDIFASILTGLLIKGNTLEHSVDVAGKFIHDATKSTILAETPIIEGVQFEPLLTKLGGNFYEK